MSVPFSRSCTPRGGLARPGGAPRDAAGGREGRRWHGLLGGLFLALAACGGGSGGGGEGPTFAGEIGDELPKPGGGTFFLDAHQAGRATRVHLVETYWARLVSVHDVDDEGNRTTTPIFRDFPINENVLSDALNYRLDVNPVTQEARLTILRTKGEPDRGDGTFLDLLEAAAANVPVVIPKHDDGSSPGPFSYVPRNGALVLRFDDLLLDDAQALLDLEQTVRISTGYPPAQPFAPRILFDPNHGGVTGGAFHSSRVIVDLAVSEAEATGLPAPVPVNSLGLPASRPGANVPNVSVRIPTRTDFATGQFELLRNLARSPLATTQNGPLDFESATLDVVRAMRSGNAEDASEGFLLDVIPPRVIGGWQATLLEAVPEAGGDPKRNFRVDLRFDGPCRDVPRTGDTLIAGSSFLEVTEGGGTPDPLGVVRDLPVRLLGGGPGLADPQSILGSVQFLTPFAPARPVEMGCWVTLSPQPATPPVMGASTDTQVFVRFSEPMNPVSIRAFDSFRVIRAPAGATVLPRNTVVGVVKAATDLKSFTLVPLLPLATQDGPFYHFQLATGPDGVRDLGGNTLRDPLASIDFTLDPTQPPQLNGGVALRFSSKDELVPLGFDDFRGQGTLDSEKEVLLGRPVSHLEMPVDRTVPIVSIMTPWPGGLQTPLSPLGSKMQTLWRYADVGWRATDETKFNMDVTGLNWTPVGGQVIADFYDRFEIALSHANKLPDEKFANNRPKYPDSGIGMNAGGACVSGPPPVAFIDNILQDPVGAQKVVHPRQLGYRIDPANAFAAATGTIMIPFPLNEGPGEAVTYTWRDTAVLAKAGLGGAGLPMEIEVGTPLFVEPAAGTVATAGNIPSIGLPLLWEVRCFPSPSGVGLNALDINIPINTFCNPNFRAFSTGGVDTSGTRVEVDPDQEPFPMGGFNPSSMPPGQRTLLNADNTFYVGQLDMVTRVSRVHTMWLETGFASAQFAPPVFEPETQPLGARIVVDYRGADSFSFEAGLDPYDAGALDFYGDLTRGVVDFFQGDPTWKSDVRAIDGARLVQLRISFVNNIESGDHPVLDSLGVAFSDGP